MKKSIFLLLFYWTINFSYGQPARNMNIDPTGTYILRGEKYKGEIKGNHGEVRIKLLSDSLVAITMYSNKGYPDYTSASFTDTIEYTNNRAIHFSKTDSSCQIVFAFDMNGLEIKQMYTDPASTCGFEKGTIPLGYIAKYSSAVPIIQPLSRSRESLSRSHWEFFSTAPDFRLISFCFKYLR